jgi:hypothetical protein
MMSDLVKRLMNVAGFHDARTHKNIPLNDLHALHCKTVMEAANLIVANRIKGLDVELDEIYEAFSDDLPIDIDEVLEAWREN